MGLTSSVRMLSREARLSETQRRHPQTQVRQQLVSAAVHLCLIQQGSSTNDIKTMDKAVEKINSMQETGQDTLLCAQIKQQLGSSTLQNWCGFIHLFVQPMCIEFLIDGRYHTRHWSYNKNKTRILLSRRIQSRGEECLERENSNSRSGNSQKEQ